ncbi:GNAT family N-acetyltransferase [Chitinimonas sp.]|uniref:GNAT family N-acetyltransferase n=1 Tax=Chitinimonas sp. TaxID=1934313 RepID=UPI0035AF81E5
MSAIALVTPSLDYLDSYAEALQQGWSPNTLVPAAAAVELSKIEQDPVAFVASLTDRAGLGGPITLPNGAVVPRLPGYRMWLWDGEFCGSFALRWQPGTSALPSYAYGHVGYTIVPWKRRRGYAKAGLRLLLAEARREGLDYVDLTTDLDNEASHKVILANGGTSLGAFRRPVEYGGETNLRFRIAL